MVQMEDEVYEKLKKNADDNLQVKKIIRLIISVIVLLVLYFGVISKIIDVQIKRYDARPMLKFEKSKVLACQWMITFVGLIFKRNIEGCISIATKRSRKIMYAWFKRCALYNRNYI